MSDIPGVCFHHTLKALIVILLLNLIIILLLGSAAPFIVSLLLFPPDYSAVPILFTSRPDTGCKPPSCLGDVPVPLALLLLFLVITLPVARSWVTWQTSGGVHLSPDAPVNRMKT